MITIVSIALLLSVSADAGQNWPAFRGAGDSLAAASDLPLTWSASKGVAWEVELPGYGQSSPVVWGDRVFVTSMQGDNKETAVLLCVELADGKQLWKRELKTSTQVAVSPYVSRSAPTPAVDAERVYAFFESGDLVCYQHDGTEVWKRSLTDEYGPFQGNHGLGSSPALTDRALIVLVAIDGPSYLLAIDKQTGKNLWKRDREAGVSWSSPFVAAGPGGLEVITSSSGDVEAFDARSGEPLWKVTGLEGNLVPSASASPELVVIGSSAAGSNLAIRRGGQGDVSETHVAWRIDEAACSFGSPLLYQGRAYFVNRSGVVQCVDAADGKQLWQQRLADSCWASPIAAGQRIYFFTKSGETTVIKAGVDEFQILAENSLPTEEQVVGVAAVNGRFLVRTPTKLVCIGAAAR
jgi:outer membrane protein assembly factor BamB